MTFARGIRRWLARLLALGAIAAVGYGALAAVVESRRLFRYSRRHAAATLEQAQDRLFGRDYMESIRAVRRRIDSSGTVHFVDEKPPDGSSYFALFHLAPRRLVCFGRLEEPMRRVARRRQLGPQVVVLVPPQRAPLSLVELPPRARRNDDRRVGARRAPRAPVDPPNTEPSRKRGRKARP